MSGDIVKSGLPLTTSSLITVLLVSVHLADDVARQMEPGNLSYLAISVAFITIWLYGTLVLSGRMSGYIIMTLGSLLAVVIPIVHMTGAGIGVEIVRSEGGFFFVWTLLALGAGAVFTLILSVRGLWGLRRNAP